MAAELAISFGAGVVGFLSPCCLPLLPGYVGYMTGAGTAERVPLRRALPGSLAFVGGISVVFISLGAAASTISGVLNDHRRLLEQVSGTFIIALGLFMIVAVFSRNPWLLGERKFHIRPRTGPAWTFLLGASFAFGWTPCIGPTLGAALNLAATSDGLNDGIALLGAYSAGLGVPFLLAGLGLVRFGGRIKRHSLQIQAIGGAVLVAVGFLVLTGRLTLITRWMQRALAGVGLDFWNF